MATSSFSNVAFDELFGVSSELIEDMGWAERMNKPRLCATCNLEKRVPHFVVEVGVMCDECYRRMARVSERLTGTTHRAEPFEWQSYVPVVWDSGERIK